MSELFVVDGICGGTVFFLPDVPTVLGRSTECHVQIGDPWISSMHALFERRGGELWVVDLDSRNGTFVDDARVREARIGAGSRLRFGRTTAEVREPGSESELVPTPAAAQGTIVRYLSDLRSEIAEPPEAEPEPPRQTSDGSRASSSRLAHRQIAVVNEIGKALVDAVDLDECLARILRTAAAAVRGDRSSLLLMDETGNLIPRAHEPPGTEPRVSATVVDAAVRSRAGILTLDAQQDVRFSQSESVIAHGIRSCICTPVWADNRILGMLIFEREVPEPFSGDDLQLAAVVGYQAALAIERARFLEQARLGEERRRLVRARVAPELAAPLLTQEVEPDPLGLAPREEAAVLVAELDGFADASARLGTELAGPLAAALDALRSIAFDHGGIVERRGAGMAVVFGAAGPQADAAPRALRAALAMRKRIASLPSLPGGAAVALRAGIEVGRIVTGAIAAAGGIDIVALGVPVETAKRLAMAAPPGAIRVGPAGAFRVGREFALRAAEGDAGGAFDLVDGVE